MIFLFLFLVFGIHFIIIRLFYAGRWDAVSEKKKLLILCISAGIAVTCWFWYSSFFPGSGKYYVNMFTNDQSSKNYRLVSDVEKNNGYYYLKRIYFPNGGFVTFENSYGVSDLIFNKKITIQDDKGTWWEAELTREKAE